MNKVNLTKPAVKYRFTYSTDMHVHMSNGNSKLGKGVWTLNTLPGEHPISTKTTGQLTNVLGTCHGCCQGCESGGCYAISDMQRHHNACVKSWAENTLIMRHDLTRYVAEVKALVIQHKMKYVRIHSAGEWDSYEEFTAFIDLAKTLPDTQFYCYTKRFEWVSQYLEKYTSFPTNFVVNLSKWCNNMDAFPDLKSGGKCNIFAWDDGSDPEITNWKACPAVDPPKKGQKIGHSNHNHCIDCRKCMYNTGKMIKVHNH